MLISPAFAHGSGAGVEGGGYGPLIILAVAVVFVLAWVVERKWRRRRQGPVDDET
jgi:hypothetical protein